MIRSPKSPWSRGEKIAVLSVCVAVIGIVLSLSHPEVRHLIGLDQSLPSAPAAVYPSSVVHATATAISSVTSIRAQGPITVDASSPAPYGGTLVLKDPLYDNNKGYGWDEYATNSFGEACEFVGGTYEARQTKTGYLNYCKAYNTDFSNFAFEVQMEIVQGDCGGLLFRGDVSNPTNPRYFYQFQVCRDGTYRVLDTYSKVLMSNFSPVIRMGLKQSNVIAAVMRGSRIDLYLNYQKIDTGNDSSYLHGLIGIGAIEYHRPTEVIYSKARVWTF